MPEEVKSPKQRSHGAGRYCRLRLHDPVPIAFPGPSHRLLLGTPAAGVVLTAAPPVHLAAPQPTLRGPAPTSSPSQPCQLPERGKISRLRSPNSAQHGQHRTRAHGDYLRALSNNVACRLPCQSRSQAKTLSLRRANHSCSSSFSIAPFARPRCLSGQPFRLPQPSTISTAVASIRSLPRGYCFIAFFHSFPRAQFLIQHNFLLFLPSIAIGSSHLGPASRSESSDRDHRSPATTTRTSRATRISPRDAKRHRDRYQHQETRCTSRSAAIVSSSGCDDGLEICSLGTRLD